MRSGSIKQAATELNVSQPAISQSVRQLEDHLGAPLLDRSTRPAKLTEAGRLLHRATMEGFGRIREAMAEIARLNASADNAITIACSVGFATYWLMPRLAALHDRHPDIAVNVMTTHQGAPPLGPGIDIAIRYGNGDWADGMVQLLFSEKVDPVCTPELARKLRQAGTGLEEATLIHVGVEDESWIRWNRYLQLTGQPADGRRKALHFTNYVQATQAALSGLGVMLGWRSITGDLVRQGRLVPFLDAPLIPDDGFYVVRAHQPVSPQSCNAVGAWLLDIAREQVS